MQCKQMFVTAVCVLFLLKLKWPKSKNFYEKIALHRFCEAVRFSSRVARVFAALSLQSTRTVLVILDRNSYGFPWKKCVGPHGPVSHCKDHMSVGPYCSVETYFVFLNS